MRSLLHVSIAVVCLFISGAGFAADETVVAEGGPMGTDARSGSSAQEVPAQRGRLRFRDGPVCMCDGGLSEAEIQRADEERQRRRGGNG